MLRQQWTPDGNEAGRVARLGAQPAGLRCRSHKGSVSAGTRGCSGSLTAAQKSENDAFWNDVGISFHHPPPTSPWPLAVGLGHWHPSRTGAGAEVPRRVLPKAPSRGTVSQSHGSQATENSHQTRGTLAQLQPGRGKSNIYRTCHTIEHLSEAYLPALRTSNYPLHVRNTGEGNVALLSAN